MKEKFFQHPNAIVETDDIGIGTRIWAFVHLLPDVKVGVDCNLCDHVFIENDVVIGDRVTIKSGVQLWSGITVKDDVFIGPNATFTNDPFPRSKQYLDDYKRTIIHKGASIGANATILPGLSIEQYAMVGAGAVVTKNVPPYAVVVGNPARIVGYVQTNQYENKTSSPLSETQKNVDVDGVEIYTLPVVSDLRGDLTFAEYKDTLPFLPKRYFLVYNVPSKDVRGEHAHLECHQFLVCVKGSCSVVVDDGKKRSEILLNAPSIGLHIHPMVWATQYKYSEDAVLLVFASDEYKAEDYIRNYGNFMKMVKENG